MTPSARLVRKPSARRDRRHRASATGEVASPAHGAIVLFLGVVREVNDGRAVTGIESTGAYETMAKRPELDAIADEAAAKFELGRHQRSCTAWARSRFRR